MNFSDLHPLTLNDRNLVMNYQQQFSSEISEHTFSNLVMWGQSRPIWFAEVLDSIIFCIHDNSIMPDNFILFGPPIGKASTMDVLRLADGFLEAAVRIPIRQTKQLARAAMRLVPDPNNSDYVYRVKDLILLKGRNFAKKRNHIKRCLETYDCRYETINKDNLKECSAMQDRWCKHRLCEIHPGLGNENRALGLAIEHYHDWNLMGGAIRIDGTIQAFSIAEQLNPTTAVWHFEKAIPDFPGLAQLINNWFAKHALGNFTFVNREQDLGIPGLRKAKMSYHPHHMVEKFSCFND